MNLLQRTFQVCHGQLCKDVGDELGCNCKDDAARLAGAIPAVKLSLEGGTYD